MAEQLVVVDQRRYGKLCVLVRALIEGGRLDIVSKGIYRTGKMPTSKARRR